MNNNIEIYKCAYEYLLKILPDKLTESDLEKYFKGDRAKFTVFLTLSSKVCNFF